MAIFVDLLAIYDLVQAMYKGQKDLDGAMFNVYNMYNVEIDSCVSYEFYMEEDFRLKAIHKISEGFSFIIFKE